MGQLRCSVTTGLARLTARMSDVTTRLRRLRGRFLSTLDAWLVWLVWITCLDAWLALCRNVAGLLSGLYDLIRRFSGLAKYLSDPDRGIGRLVSAP